MRKKRTMISEKQLAANRANAEKSTGPQTPEGKNRSKLNAVRHNLTGQVAALTEPDRVAFNAFSQDLIRDLDPRARPPEIPPGRAHSPPRRRDGRSQTPPP